MTRDATPAKAVFVLVLIFLFASGLNAAGRRYGFSGQAFADCLYFLCGLLLVDLGLLRWANLKSAGLRGVLQSGAIGLLCGLAVAAMLLWRISSVKEFQFESMAWTDIVHSAAAAPVSEELLVVGFLFVTLRTRFRLASAALIVCLLFTVAHIPNSAMSFALRFVYMFASCMVFERFRSLALNIGMHSIANGLPLVVAHQPQLYVESLASISGALPYLATLCELAAVVLVLKIGGRHLMSTGPMPPRPARTQVSTTA